MRRLRTRQEVEAALRQITSNTRRRISSPQMIGPMLEAQKRERDLLVREFAQIKGLMPLLMKRRNGGRWSGEERLVLREQVQALVHLSPYLVVLVLPGSFAILPVLAWWLDRRRIQRSNTRSATLTALPAAPAPSPGAVPLATSTPPDTRT